MSDVADPALSQVVLIGVSRYADLPALPAVERNVLDLANLLQDDNLWGVPPENCRVLINPTVPGDVSAAVRAAAIATERDGLLIVYYAGHGLVDGEDDDALILALPDCDPDVPQEKGLPYDWVRKAVSRARARRRVVILDCCYSGRADPDMGGTDVVADKAQTAGSSLLVSAPANRRARAPHGEVHTAFTGELIRFLRTGYQPAHPGLPPPPTLTVDLVWQHVRDAMLRRKFERPELRAHDSGAAIALVNNPAVPWRNLAGSVLYAAPWFDDDDLGERAILVLRHNDTGALGVCITKPDGEIPPDFPDEWRPKLCHPAMLFDGGPVARDGYIVVTVLRDDADRPLRYTPIRGQLGTLALSALPEDIDTAVDTMRVFVGYLGWRAGELEEYLRSGALMVSPHGVRQVFTERPGELWQTLQARR